MLQIIMLKAKTGNIDLLLIDNKPSTICLSELNILLLDLMGFALCKIIRMIMIENIKIPL